MGVTATRRPGVTFEARTPPVLSPLPRMDIAGFVGFACSGPVNVPVAVEEPARFHDIFGEDLPLARDDRTGELVYAELPAAVRAFFRNGGVRCWVVRVAGETAAANQFVLPGLLAAGSSPTDVGAALADARSPGSWSDSMLVNTSISLTPLRILPPASPPSHAVGGLKAGDLIQIVYPSSRVVAFQEVADDQKERPPVTVVRPSHWFREAVRADVDPAPASPPEPLAWLAAPSVVRWLRGAPASDPALPFARWGIDDDGFILELDRSELRGVQPGSWLRVELASAPAGATPFLLLQVDRIHAARDDASPPSPEPVWIRATRAWSILDPAAAAAEVAGIEPRASLVTFELWARERSRGTARLADLGFTAVHDRYWGDVPNDELVFRRDPKRPARLDDIAPSLLKDVLNPRFPLAAAAPSPNPGSRPFYLPLGMTGIARDEFYQAALPQGASMRARDGLLTLNETLFLDHDPGSTLPTLLVSATRLMAEAFQIQYINEYLGPGASRLVGRDLTGLHALLPIEEISFMAVPDILQRPWYQEPSAIVPLDPPTLLEVSAGAKTVHLEWTPVQVSPHEQGITYTVQASFGPRFAVVTRSWTVEESWRDHDADLFTGCPARVFYRVRALSPTRGRSPWSNTRCGLEPSSTFARCPEEQPPAPAPVTVTEERGRLIVEWGAIPGAAIVYTLERASDEEFASATVVYRGPLTMYEVLRGAESVVYFRVAAVVDGEPSPWSVTVRAGQVESVAFVTDPAAEYDDGLLLRVQAAAVRMCAARADLHAVLGLPLHFRDDRALEYAARLSAELATDEPRVSSYAALFHPWVVVRETSGRPDLSRWVIAPDGPVAGAIAARTLRSGAWYSPANQLLRGVIDLQPALGDGVLGLLEGRVNPIWQQPRGFSAVDALTLHPGDELGQLHVRRLMILLRRLVTREGPAMVFRPNDDSLRRLVQREFERILGDLFVRGAFAGETHDEGYRVVADATVNTPQSIDLGRCLVELQVAPSQPLSFLTVRLVQEGGTLLAVQEA
jgi:hypothetical protein